MIESSSGRVDRAVVSDARGPEFKSSQHLVPVYYMGIPRKVVNREKEKKRLGLVHF